MKASNFFVILILLFIVLISSIFLIGIYYFDWFKTEKSNNYSIYIQIPVEKNNKLNYNINDLSSDKVLTKNTKDEIDNIKKDISLIEKNSKIITEKKEDSKSKLKLKNKISKTEFKENANYFVLSDNSQDGSFGKGSNLVTQEFHSLGEHVSEEEYNYRLSLIKDLKIKTVVIDSITTGNGVSQEYYKIVFKTKMIPAKVMDNVIISKEFRELIPKKYLTKEVEISGLKNGEKIVFKNSEIRDILIKWSLGRLTPIEKAWESKAL